MKSTLLFLILLASPALGQQLVDPVKVTVSAMASDEDSARLVGAVRAQLRTLGYIGIVERNADYVISLMAAPIEGMACEGYAAAMFAGRVPDKRSDRASMHTAADLPTLARHLVSKLEREFFKRR